MNGCPCPSCAVRASWTPEERAHFDREDDAREAAEALSFAAPSFENADPGPVLALRLVRPVADLTGRRFGHLIVIGPVLIERAGYVRSEWSALCDCGRRITLSGHRLVKRGDISCRPCANARHSYARRLKVGGLDLWDLAVRAGVKRETIRSRIRSGWPAALLALPLQPNIGSRDGRRVA